MTSLTLSRRLLFLSADPAVVRAQLGGQDVTLAEAGPLRDDVSTDEITPIPSLTYFDERLGRYPYTGLKSGDELTIGTDSVKNGGFSVTIAGKRYGKGSSREHSPQAEWLSGIRLVIAESFERIYRQNADNIGLFTSSDFGLIERIRRGESIDVEELVADRDTVAGAILRSGGLLRYGAQRMRNVLASDWDGGGNPMTLAEKILAGHVLKTEDTNGTLIPGNGAFVKADWRYIIEVYTGMCTHMMHKAFGRPVQLFEPQSIIAFEDHFSYTHKSPAHISGNLLPGIRILSAAHRDFVSEYGVLAHGYQSDQEGSEGICHALMTEHYALPGQLIAATDSHTPHSGALGCVAFGVGTTDMANAMLTGAVRLTAPDTLRVDFDGVLPIGLTGKDLLLVLLAHPKIRAGAGLGKVFEFAGPVVRGMSTDERATLTNMAAELGGFTGIVEPDDETVRFLWERRGIDFRLEPWMKSDSGARYADIITIDCTKLSAMVAAPGDPGNGIPLAEVRSLNGRVKIDIAYGGSCTGGKREDFDNYHQVLSWAAERRLAVPDDVVLYLQFGTTSVRDYCEEHGYLAVFRKIGAQMLQPACGACANLGPGASTRSDQVTVSATNRNFAGRSGPGKVWLASPLTVAASAIAGELISFDQLRNRYER